MVSDSVENMESDTIQNMETDTTQNMSVSSFFRELEEFTKDFTTSTNRFWNFEHPLLHSDFIGFGQGRHFSYGQFVKQRKTGSSLGVEDGGTVIMSLEPPL